MCSFQSSIDNNHPLWPLCNMCYSFHQCFLISFIQKRSNVCKAFHVSVKTFFWHKLFCCWLSKATLLIFFSRPTNPFEQKFPLTSSLCWLMKMMPTKVHRIMPLPLHQFIICLSWFYFPSMIWQKSRTSNCLCFHPFPLRKYFDSKLFVYFRRHHSVACLREFGANRHIYP